MHVAQSLGGQTNPDGRVTFEGSVRVGERGTVETVVHTAGGQVKSAGIVKSPGREKDDEPVGSGQVKLAGKEKPLGSVKVGLSEQGVVRVTVEAVGWGQVKFSGMEKLAGT